MIHALFHGKDTEYNSHVEQYSTQNWQHTLKTDTNTLSKITDKHGQLTVFFFLSGSACVLDLLIKH